MTEWEKRAKHCEENYDTLVNWEECFFICPFCEEPIYECDYSENEWSDEFLCPVCEQ